MKHQDYTREMVEHLLTAAWDDGASYGMSQELPIDPMMPKAKANPAHGNMLPAMLADIHRALESGTLSLKEERALILSFGLGWSREDAGYNQGVSERAISYRIDSGVGRIVAWLNGHRFIDEEVQV